MRFTDRADAAHRLAVTVAEHLATLPAGPAGLSPEPEPVPGLPAESVPGLPAGPAPGLSPGPAPGLRAGAVLGRPLVLGLARGGVPMAVLIARHIDGDLDVTVARKIGAPRRPEFGIGAVAATGDPIFDDRSLARLGLTATDLAPDVTRERTEARRRITAYRGDRPSPQVRGRVVIVVDDGLATGVTARAAVRALRAAGPAHLALAVPVCTPEARDLLATETDAVLCLHCPPDFHAVGAYYDDFAQLTDADVHAALSAAAGG